MEAGEQMLDDRKIQTPDISQNQAARTCARAATPASSRVPAPVSEPGRPAARTPPWPQNRTGPESRRNSFDPASLPSGTCPAAGPGSFPAPACRPGMNPLRVGKRNQLHDQPVHNQQQPCYHYLPPDGQMKKANGRNQVAGGDGLEPIAVQGHLRRFKNQQVPLHHHPQQKKHHHPLGHLQVNLPHGYRADAPGKRKTAWLSPQ